MQSNCRKEAEKKQKRFLFTIRKDAFILRIVSTIKKLMSFYIKPKFQIGQLIFSIKEDKIHQINVESIFVSTDRQISYLSNNGLFLESQSFETRQEAEDFLMIALRIPFGNDWVWAGDLSGVKRVEVKKGGFWFKDSQKHYNSQIHAGDRLSAQCFETQQEALEAILQQLKNFK